MEKNLKKVRTFAILLIVILISLLAFGGLFVKKGILWNNVLPEFKYGKDFNGIRELRYVVDTSEEDKKVYVDDEGNILGEVKEDSSTESTLETEEGDDVSKEESNVAGYNKETRTIKSNEDSALTKENFEKSKKIIQKRLESKENYDYNIRLDTITGEIIVEIPDNDEVQDLENLVSAVGNIEIIDYQNGLILMDDSLVKSAKVVSSNNSGYRAYLQLNFTKEGADKLKEISNNYQKTTSEDGTETTKYVSIMLDGQSILTTYFGEELSDGVIQVPLGETTEDYQEYLAIVHSAEELALIINGENMPVAYTLSSDNFIQSEISENNIYIVKIIFSICIILISIYMIIKYKIKGLKSAILCIGYAGLLILTIKYTNVYVTLNSAIAYLLMICINYVFTIKLLDNLQEGMHVKEALLKNMKETYLTIIPVIVVAFVFTFMASISINSIGMMLFWGIIIHAIYNFAFTLFTL